jgi:hypothetical protein
MKTLEEMYYSKHRGTTDKGGDHDYIRGYYSNEFSDKRDRSLNFIEIGVHEGDSIRVWVEWFTNANIYGVDVRPALTIDGATILSGDAYSSQILDKFENNFFDYIIDDGPHTIQSQIDCINRWYPKLKVGGKIIIEDIQDVSTISTLESCATLNGATHKVFDLRANIGRADDIIVEVTKV